MQVTDEMPDDLLNKLTIILIKEIIARKKIEIDKLYKSKNTADLFIRSDIKYDVKRLEEAIKAIQGDPY